MNKKKHFWLIIILLIGCNVLYSQSREIRGTVHSTKDNQVLPGVTIIIKYTEEGTTSDFDGNFSIEASPEDVLVFTSIGYDEIEVAVGDQTDLNIKMAEAPESLSEVVVTALGVSRKEQSLGYAISKVDGKEISEIKNINVVNALSGKVAGVDIGQPNTGVGGSSRVIIRGNSQITGNNQPLYVIDGVPMNNDNLGDAGQYGGQDLGDGISSINQDDIKTMSVLKGPAAAALYGTRASNGVVLITTKTSSSRNLKNHFKVNFTSNTTVDNIVAGYKDLQHVYGQGVRTPPKDVGDAAVMWSWGGKLDPDLSFISFDGKFRDYGLKKNNLKSFFRTGVTSQNTISLDGGNKNANFRFSASDVRMTDIVPNSDLKRNNFAIRGNINMWDKLKLDSKVNFIIENVNNRPYLGFSGANTALALLGLPDNVDQRWLEESVVNNNDEYVFWNSSTRIINPYYALYKMKNNSKKNRVLGYAALTYQFNDWINLKVKSGIDTYTYNYFNYSPRTTPLAEWGEMREINSRNTETNSEFLLSVNKKLSNFWKLDASVGGNIMTTENRITDILGKGQSTSGIQSINNYKEFNITYKNPRKQVNSLYGFANFAFKEFLFIDITARNDWSSTLPKANSSYFYPSISTAFVFTKAVKKLKNKLLSYGKLRASYAEVGGDTDPYQLVQDFSNYPYTLGGNSLETEASNVLPNPNLKPSRTRGYEIGLDAKLLNWRIGLDITYYNQTTFDEIIRLPISNASAYEYAYLNAGEINNTGWEVMVNFVPVKREELRWDLTFNFATNKNKIIKLHREAKVQTLAKADWVSSFIQAREGGSYGDIIGYDFKRIADGTPILDAKGLPIRSDKQIALGNGQYKLTSGVTNTIKYKGFKLRALVQAKFGADILSMTNLRLHQVGGHINTLEGREGWTQSESERLVANVKIDDWVATNGYLAEGVIQSGTDTDGNPIYRENDVFVDPKDYWGHVANKHIMKPFVYDSSYIKLREVAISYDLDKKIIESLQFVESITFSLVGRNLWLIYTKVPNIDPESGYSISNGQGYEYGSLPQRRSIGFNININF